MNGERLLEEIIKLRPNYTRDEATRYARELSSPEHADLKDTHNWFACAELMATVGFNEKQRKSDDDGLSGTDKRLIDKAKSAERQLDPPDKRGSVALSVLLDSFVAGLVTLGVIFALDWALRNWAGIVLSDQMVLRGCWFAIAARKLRNNEVYMTLYAGSLKVTQQKSSGEVISEEQLSQQELENAAKQRGG